MVTTKVVSRYAESPSEEFSGMFKAAYDVHVGGMQAVENRPEYQSPLSMLGKIGMLEAGDGGKARGLNYEILGPKESVGVLEIYTKLLERFYKVTYRGPQSDTSK